MQTPQWHFTFKFKLQGGQGSEWQGFWHGCVHPVGLSLKHSDWHSEQFCPAWKKTILFFFLVITNELRFIRAIFTNERFAFGSRDHVTIFFTSMVFTRKEASAETSTRVGSCLMTRPVDSFVPAVAGEWDRNLTIWTGEITAFHFWLRHFPGP